MNQTPNPMKTELVFGLTILVIVLILIASRRLG